MKYYGSRVTAPSVMVVDDDECYRETMIFMVRTLGYRTISAQDGVEGMARYIMRRPDLIITDIVMPGRDGLYLIKEIRRHDLITPIIAMSAEIGFVIDGKLRTAEALGATALLSKPTPFDELKGVIARLLDNPNYSQAVRAIAGERI